jgi:hypothetical protein
MVREIAPGVVGVEGVGDLLGVSRETVRVYNYRAGRARKRGTANARTLPPPDGTIAGQPVWFTVTISAWRERREATPPESGRPPGRRLDAAHWRQVARVWRRAKNQGRAVVPAVADHFRVAESTASRWIRTAREKGLIE